MKLVNGKEISEKIKQEISERIIVLDSQPGLAIILIGNNPSSITYTSLKEKACKETGIHVEKYHYPETTDENIILDKIKELNKDEKINGILIQLPLPKKFNANKIVNSVNPIKDVDGLHSLNLGNLSRRIETIAPATPKAILKIFEKEQINLEGKNIVIINSSIVIGRPLADIFLNRGATVTICNKKTRNLENHTKEADILISATGVPNLINKEMVKQGAIVIDAGFSKINGKVCGDICSDVKEKCSLLSPVPGGAGPMTIAALLENVLILQDLQNS